MELFWGIYMNGKYQKAPSSQLDVVHKPGTRQGVADFNPAVIDMIKLVRITRRVFCGFSYPCQVHSGRILFAVLF